jgi:hypothetical protein
MNTIISTIVSKPDRHLTANVVALIMIDISKNGELTMKVSAFL